MQTCTTTAADCSIDSADDNDFIPVVRKQKSRKSRKNGHGLVMKERSSAEKLEKSMAELRSDVNWLDKCAQTVRDAAGALPGRIQTILCLGLGSPTESTQARFQLCFLLELRDTILPNPVLIQAFDPIFSPEDRLLLTSLGIQILLDNKEGRYELDKPTLAYMPHCDRELYENFLRANWHAAASASASASSLTELLLLIGNDLREYACNIPARVLGKESPCISLLAPLLTATPLPEHRAFPNAFSSTAVQHIPINSAASLSASSLPTTPPFTTHAQLSLSGPTENSSDLGFLQRKEPSARDNEPGG